MKTEIPLTKNGSYKVKTKQGHSFNLNVVVMHEFIAREAAKINDPELRGKLLDTVNDPRFQ